LRFQRLQYNPQTKDCQANLKEFFYNITSFEVVFFVSIIQRTVDLLKSSGKKQREMAGFIGVPERTISTWKDRGTDPPSKVIPSIAEFFDVSLEWLLTGEEKASRSTLNGDVNGSAFVQGVNRGSVTVHNGTEHAISAEAAELLRIYEGLDFRSRLELLNKAVALKDAMQPKNGG
jgi:transcriptional regulator with XRE-family HTH domain